MIVTTAVNECGYCSWFHAKQAVASGVSADEVGDMFQLQFQANASPRELTALLYAQHFAETNRNPDAEMTARLFDDYGERTAKHILVLIRTIYFGNLFGNTWDAVLSRFKGHPANGEQQDVRVRLLRARVLVHVDSHAPDEKGGRPAPVA